MSREARKSFLSSVASAMFGYKNIQPDLALQIPIFKTSMWILNGNASLYACIQLSFVFCIHRHL